LIILKHLKRTIDVAEGWQFLAVQAVLIIILEIVAMILLSDCISMLILENPNLRAQIVWSLFGLAEHNRELFTFYAISIAITYLLLIFLQGSFILRTALIAYDLSSRVFESLGTISFTQYSKIDKSNLSSVLVPETQRAASAVIIPVFNLISKLFMVLAILAYLWFQLGPEIIWLTVIFIPYAVILTIVVRILKPNSITITEHQAGRQAIIANLYVADKNLYFTKYFERLKANFVDLNTKLGAVLGQNSILVQLPKYGIELTIGLSALLANMFFLQSADIALLKGENASLLIVALLKALPGIQQIYRSISLITGNFSSLENIVESLNNIKQANLCRTKTKHVRSIVADGNRKGFELLDTEFTVHGTKVKFNPVTVEPGDVVVVGGQSGLGKTTICENLLHLRNDINVESLEDLRHDRQVVGSLYAKIGYAGQTSFCDATDLSLTLSSQKQMSPYQLKQLISAWDLTGLLTDFLEEKSISFAELSGGQRRKLSLLTAMLSDTPLVFLDEPTNDLDRKSCEVLMKTILELLHDQKRIFLIITHDNELKKIATKCTELSKIC
jgi:ABC-type transport system involved in cytochrome bd biosynthesis fused ATPase/permease subunit